MKTHTDMDTEKKKKNINTNDEEIKDTLTNSTSK